MTCDDRARWEARYASPGQDLSRPPNALLTRHVLPALPGARALELACGLGINALWLAGQGYAVDAIDISFRALSRARAEMQRRGAGGVTFIQADLDHFSLPPAAYDLVVVFRFLDRRLFPAIIDSVRPGGLVIYETLNTGHRARMPDANPDHMLRSGELPGYFSGWRVIEAGDGEFLSAFVGQKPAALN